MKFVGLCLIMSAIGASVAEAQTTVTVLSETPSAIASSSSVTVRHHQRKHHHRSKTVVKLASGMSTGTSVSVVNRIRVPVKTSGCN